MSGFVSLPAVAPAGPVAVENDGWWPDVVLADVRAAVKLDTTVTDDRLVDVAAAAVLFVNRELGAWRALAEADPASPANLAAVPSVAIGGVSARVRLYLRAVQAETKAELDEGYRGADTAGISNVQTRADALTPVIADSRRRSREAIRDFLGVPRVTVALI